MTDLQGRSPEHQARNAQACEVIAELFILLIVIAAVVWLVARVAGWA